MTLRPTALDEVVFDLEGFLPDKAERWYFEIGNKSYKPEYKIICESRAKRTSLAHRQ